MTTQQEIVANLVAVLQASGRFRVIGIVGPVLPADLPSRVLVESQVRVPCAGCGAGIMVPPVRAARPTYCPACRQALR